MIHQTIHLNQHYPLKNDPILQIYRPRLTDSEVDELRRGILIFPGGAYEFVSEREKDPIALRFNTLGYIAFTLAYSVTSKYPGPLYPIPQLEALAAVDYIKKHAEEFNIDKDNLTLMGFSAGGHLASSYPIASEDDSLLSLLKLSKEDAKVHNLVLGYPVISLADFTHLGTSKNLTGSDMELKRKISANHMMNENYPRTFIWTTKDDDVVPYQNSTMLVEQLEKFNIPHELKIYETGPHGLSLATKELNKWFEGKLDPEIRHWVELADDFLRKF